MERHVLRCIGCLKKDGEVVRVCNTTDVDGVLSFLDSCKNKRGVDIYPGAYGLPCRLKCGKIDIKFCWITYMEHDW